MERELKGIKTPRFDNAPDNGILIVRCVSCFYGLQDIKVVAQLIDKIISAGRPVVPATLNSHLNCASHDRTAFSAAYATANESR